MAVTVVVRSGDLESPPSLTFDSPRIVIGRADGCEVRLPDPSVSHRHASIRVEGTGYQLFDEGSSNGTFVGATRLQPGAGHPLQSGSLFRVGRIWLEVVVEQAVPSTSPKEATNELALALVAEALAAGGEDVGATVRVKDGPDAGLELLVSESDKRYVLGRSKGCDLTVTDADASRRHVEIFRRGDGVWVRDLGSKNGASLAGQDLAAEEETRWPAQQALKVGGNELVYEDPVAEALAELERAADEHIPKGEVIDPPAGTDAPPVIASEPAPAVEPRRGAPVADVPRAARPAPTRNRSGWAGADYLVALLAIAVLVISLLALFWLFQA